jgi:hypothetical protein
MAEGIMVFGAVLVNFFAPEEIVLALYKSDLYFSHSFFAVCNEIFFGLDCKFQLNRCGF